MAVVTYTKAVVMTTQDKSESERFFDRVTAKSKLNQIKTETKNNKTKTCRFNILHADFCNSA